MIRWAPSDVAHEHNRFAVRARPEEYERRVVGCVNAALM